MGGDTPQQSAQMDPEAMAAMQAQMAQLMGGATGVDPAMIQAAQMEAMLREARPDLDVEVVNAGVPSYTTAESLANLAYRIVDLEPDMIVVYHAVNDYRTRVYSNYDPAYFHYRKVWDGSADKYQTGEGELRGGINPFIQHVPPDPNGNQADNVARSGTGASVASRSRARIPTSS